MRVPVVGEVAFGFLLIHFPTSRVGIVSSGLAVMIISHHWGQNPALTTLDIM